MSLPNMEGAGKAGREAHPQPHAQSKKAHEKVHHRFAGTIRPSLRDGFNGVLRARPGDRLCCLRRLVRCASIVTKLDASIGASGPHDFSVRERRPSSGGAAYGHRILHQTFVTTRTPLLIRRRTREEEPLICPTGQAHIFAMTAGQPTKSDVTGPAWRLTSGTKSAGTPNLRILEREFRVRNMSVS